MNKNPLPTLKPGDSHSESLIEAAIQGHADTREAMRWLVRQLVPATQPAEVTLDEVMQAAKKATAPEWQDVIDGWHMGLDLMAFARSILALRPQQSGLTGCNCRWDGDTQVQWCELHLAHKEAIHEWAERAKEAEKQLTLRPAAVPMTREQMIEAVRPLCRSQEMAESLVAISFDEYRAIEAFHSIGITAQAKKETP